MKRIGQFVFAWMVAFAPLAAQPFVHPGLLQSRHDLDFMKGKVDAGEQPWKHAWENLLQQPHFPSRTFNRRPPHTSCAALRGGTPSAIAICPTAPTLHTARPYSGTSRAIGPTFEMPDAWSATRRDFEGNDANCSPPGPARRSAMPLRTWLSANIYLNCGGARRIGRADTGQIQSRGDEADTAGPSAVFAHRS